MSLFTAGAALVAVLFAVLAIAGQAFAQGAVAGSPVTTLHFGAEVWIAIASVLMAIGASIEQLRRARIDIREGIKNVATLDTKIDATAAKLEARFNLLPDQYVRRDFWASKMQSIEDEQRAARSSTERIERRIDTLLLSTKPQ